MSPSPWRSLGHGLQKGWPGVAVSALGAAAQAWAPGETWAAVAFHLGALVAAGVLTLATLLGPGDPGQGVGLVLAVGWAAWFAVGEGLSWVVRWLPLGAPWAAAARALAFLLAPVVLLGVVWARELFLARRRAWRAARRPPDEEA